MPSDQGQEIAFVGRSNAGKSTFLNRVLGRKELAHTSGQPGKTRECNFYRISYHPTKTNSPEATASNHPELTFVDLPGYGYAKFSQRQREHLSKLIVTYLSQRESLAGVCLLHDAKRKPERDEFAVRDIAFERGIPFLVVATKVDRFNQKEKRKYLRQVATAFGLEEGDLLLAGKNIPPKGFWEWIQHGLYTPHE